MTHIYIIFNFKKLKIKFKLSRQAFLLNSFTELYFLTKNLEFISKHFHIKLKKNTNSNFF